MDDDFEFLKGYDKVLKDAIHHMDEDKNIGLIHFKSVPLHQRNEQIMKKREPKEMMALNGGMLARRLEGQETLYPSHC